MLRIDTGTLKGINKYSVILCVILFNFVILETVFDDSLLHLSPPCTHLRAFYNFIKIGLDFFKSSSGPEEVTGTGFLSSLKQQKKLKDMKEGFSDIGYQPA